MAADSATGSSAGRTGHVYYGFSAERPLIVSLPGVEATPDTPLPDAAPFLRVCAGIEEPGTAMLRIAREMVGMWRYTHEHRPTDPDEVALLNEKLNLAVFLLDQEADGHLKSVAHQVVTPLSPSTYGQWVAWLIWRYVLYALRQHDPGHAARDAAALTWCIESFNELAAAAREGRLRLPKDQGPEDDGAQYPPRRVWPENTGTGTEGH
ncbi:hypothetical protein [Nocardia blacklockiae]|uniref:hypothetical protein n=1 Tax=Nocardia blacklockiae TaxID=480036 RepID=UPI001895B177|nr:hypothetical protein [Nocardia blacklockiae]MBF6176012.1 hypothetical protein [Nocardia blacklockiae]